MSLNDIRKSSANFFELHKTHMATATAAIASSSAAPSATSSRQTQGGSSSSKPSNQTTSPNELPPPSPASSVGSSAGSVNCATSAETSSAQQLMKIQEIMTVAKRCISLNDYNVRSQTTWDINERQIGQNKSLSGQYYTHVLVFYFSAYTAALRNRARAASSGVLWRVAKRKEKI